MIGFDRSAFAARPPGAQSKSESCCCSIHHEGLPELPIKSSNQMIESSVVIITKLDNNKAIWRRASCACRKPARKQGQAWYRTVCGSKRLIGPLRNQLATARRFCNGRASEAF